MFADDATLVAMNPEDFQQLLNSFVTVAKQSGLNLNVDKTKCIYVSWEYLYRWS